MKLKWSFIFLFSWNVARLLTDVTHLREMDIFQKSYLLFFNSNLYFLLLLETVFFFVPVSLELWWSKKKYLFIFDENVIGIFIYHSSVCWKFSFILHLNVKKKKNHFRLDSCCCKLLMIRHSAYCLLSVKISLFLKVI